MVRKRFPLDDTCASEGVRRLLDWLDRSSMEADDVHSVKYWRWSPGCIVPSGTASQHDAAVNVSRRHCLFLEVAGDLC